ncbi:MAG: acetyl-CoA carboxylase biotin carboxyl carrier protein subunit [Betaproteobacteria bacterium]|nr:acetyl-CoA carboxylase biotin carboxyl carrier protein subunit [Betaproteobacteria bacterium]
MDSLTDDEVRQIALLVETLEKSSFDFLQLGVGNLKVTIGKGSLPPGAVPGVPAAAPAVAAPAAPAMPAPVAAAPASAPAPAAAPAQPASGPAADGTVAVVAPMMGRFYARPEPGAAPFVSVGAQVSADSTVGLIEVMKVFTAVRAGVAGVITEICVQDAEFIEYGHVLFRVRPAEADAAPAGAKGSRKGART